MPRRELGRGRFLVGAGDLPRSWDSILSQLRKFSESVGKNF